MITTKTKRRIIVTMIEAFQVDLFMFKYREIRLPANVRRIVGVMVTASGFADVGTVTLQSNDRADVFFKAILRDEAVDHFYDYGDEALLNVDQPQLETNVFVATGYIPKFHPVDVGGDTAIIRAWLQMPGVFVLRIYIQYEEAEELLEVIAEENIDTGQGDPTQQVVEIDNAKSYDGAVRNGLYPASHEAVGIPQLPRTVS